VDIKPELTHFHHFAGITDISQINVVGQLRKLITLSVLELELRYSAEYVCFYVLFCLKSKLVLVEVNRGQKSPHKTTRSVKLTHSFLLGQFCYFYALNGRSEQLKVDYIPTQTRSQAVARIADRTASQQTVYKLAIVAK